MISLARILVALGAIATAAASPTSVTALEARQSKEIQIQSVGMKGACSLGKTASVQILADKRTFTVIYDKFIARAGPGTKDADYQKLCELRVKFTHASGYAFNVFNSEQRGFTQLKKGDKADIEVLFGYSEANQEVSRKSSINGPINQDYLKADNFTSTQTNWSPCGTSGEIIITIEITLDAQDPKGNSQITLDSTDFTFAKAPTSQTKKC